MRKGCSALVAVVVLLVIAAGVFLASGYYAELPRVRLSTDQRLLNLASRVPAEAEQFIVAPAFGPAIRVLSNHPITRTSVESLEGSGQVKLLGALVGAAPFAAWREDDTPRLIIEVTGWRRALLLMVARFGSVTVTSTDRGVAIGGPLQSGRGEVDAAFDGQGHLFVFHGEGGDRYPPVGRPAVTAVTFDEGELRALSASRSSEPPTPKTAAVFEHPQDALLTIAFWRPHAALRDLDRFLPVDLQRLASRGASLVIYDVATKGLLPRPKGLIALPETQEAVDAAASLFNAAAFEQLGDEAVRSRTVGGVRIDRGKRLGATIEVARAHGRVYIGFDSQSLERYLAAKRTALTAAEGGEWSVRADAERLRPVIDELAHDRGLRLVASRVSRSVRQMRSLLRLLPNAKAIVGDKYTAGGLERVDLVVHAK